MAKLSSRTDFPTVKSISDFFHLVKDSTTASYKMTLQSLFKAVVTTISGTSHTFDTEVGLAYLRYTSASAVVVTIPLDATVSLPIGTKVTVMQAGAGAVTVIGATGVTLNGTSAGSVATAAQYEGIALIKVATDTWEAPNKGVGV